MAHDTSYRRARWKKTSIRWRSSPERPPVIIVTGPTASGKSGLALALARRFSGVVINGDALQVYRELEILTARPGPADLAAAPHRLYGVLPGAQACSAAVWRDLALGEIAAAREAGRLPIVVGGTGLYLRALVRGLAPLPEIPADVRKAARARFEALGLEAFRDELVDRDPTAGAPERPPAPDPCLGGARGDRPAPGRLAGGSGVSTRRRSAFSDWC